MLLTLVEQEQIIEKNIKPFVEAGKALLEIRDNWEYYQPQTSYSKFTDYLRNRWSALPQSTLYQQLNVLEVNAALPEPTTKDAHATALYKILGHDKELLNEAWGEVIQTTDKPTAKYIETVAKKHWLMAHDEKLGELVKYGQITPDKAYGLALTLEKLPEYYIDAVYSFGVGEDCVSPDTLNAIRSLEYYDKDEALDILRGGYLGETPLWQLTARDVTTYTKRLTYEKTNQQQLKASDRQKAQVKSGVKILDGFDVWNIDPTENVMYYLFPNGDISINEFSKVLEKANLKVYFLAAYPTENEPNLNFDGKPVRPSETLVKPKNLIDYINNSVI